MARRKGTLPSVIFSESLDRVKRASVVRRANAEAKAERDDVENSGPGGYLGHINDFIADNIDKAAAAIPGFLGDLVTEGVKAVGQSNPLIKHLVGDKLGQPQIPGTGTASQVAQKVKQKIVGKDVEAQNEGEKYLGAVVQGAVGAATPAGVAKLPAVIKTVAIGGAGGAAAEATHELLPDSSVAPVAAGIVASLLTHKAVEGAPAVPEAEPVPTPEENFGLAPTNRFAAAEIYHGNAEAPENVHPIPAQEPPAAPVRPEDVLTPAERQDMDASVPKPDVMDSVERHITTKPENVVPANDGVRIVGKLPKKGLAPANRTIDGTIYVGDEGGGHMGIPPHQDWGEFWENLAGNGGFVTPEGQYLSRREALAWVTKKEGPIPTHDIGLDAQTYRDRDAIRELENDPDKAEYEADENGNPPNEPPNGGGEEPPAGGGPDEPSGFEGMSPEEKLAKAIKLAKPAAKETKEAVSQVKKAQAKRLAEIQARGGSLPEQLKELQGKLPTADYESVAQHFTPEDVQALNQKILQSTRLPAFAKVKAQQALEKILDPDGMSVPTEHELDYLADVFSKDVIKALLSRRRGKLSLQEHIANVGGVPRTIMSSADLSAPFRQGLQFVGRKEFWKNIPTMVKMMGSEKFYNKAMEEIKSRPSYKAMREGQLAVRDSPTLYDREEFFVSNLAEEIPGIGKAIRASDRAYSGYLRKLRADVFDTIYNKGKESGIEWEREPEKLKALGRFINTATGRGHLGDFEAASQAASTIFFAPRLMKARFDTLFNPQYYYTLYKADPMIFAEQVKSMASLTAVAGTMLALAVAGGAKVEGDIRSSDGLKIRIGDTRLDILGGFQQYLRLAAELASMSKKTLSGHEVKLNSGKFGQDTGWDTLLRFGSNKLAPVPGFVRDYLAGQDPTGQKFNFGPEFGKMFVPMDISDTVESLKANGPKGAWAILPSILGFGVETHTPRHKKRTQHNDAEFGEDFGGA